MNPEAIPQELRVLKQWVCWRTEWRADQKTGELKPTKVPINARTGGNASTTDPATWSTFDEALAAATEHDGPGFVFTAGDPYTGVDLDGCRDPETGAIALWAQKIIPAFATYTEASPNGTGVHLIGRAALEEGDWHKRPVPRAAPIHGKKPAVEAYDQGRFFTVTGAPLEDTPPEINDVTGALRKLQQWLAPPKREPRPPRPESTPPLSLDDRELLERARSAENGEKFRRLFEAGDRSGYGDDDSAVDAALIALLAFWTDDSAQIERLARQSSLAREKWDEPRPGGTWLSYSIANLLQKPRKKYTPGRSSSPATNGRDPGADPEREGDAHPVSREHTTDMGNAARLARRHRHRLRYSKTHGWLIYDGRRWERDERGQVVECAKETVRAIYTEAGNAASAHDRAELSDWAKRSEAAARVLAMIGLAESEPHIPIKAAELDAHPWLLNCLNWTIDLKTGRKRAHRADDLITHLVPVSYDPEADCPRFKRFVTEIMGGSADLVDYLQRWAGYSLTGDVSEQSLLFLYGLGANGKSTLLRVLLSLLGDYAAQAAPGLLLEHRGDHHPTEIAELTGKRLIVSVEVGEGKRLAEELLKQMTGGDRLKGRFMRQDFFEFDAQFKLMLAANHKPVIRGTDHAIWRRIPLVPFTMTFTADENDGHPQKDPELLDALLEELPGILAWCVQGCLKWRTERLTQPEPVRKASQAYREEMDVLGGFLADCCMIGEKLQSTAGSLYATYRTWCETSGEKMVTQTAFGKALQERGFLQERTRTARMWKGIGLLDFDSSPDLSSGQEKGRSETPSGTKGGERRAEGVTRFEGVTGCDTEFGIDELVSPHEGAMPKPASQPVTETKRVTDDRESDDEDEEIRLLLEGLQRCTRCGEIRSGIELEPDAEARPICRDRGPCSNRLELHRLASL